MVQGKQTLDPVRIGDDMTIHAGHHRVIAATILSLRTGRPVFSSQGPNAILGSFEKPVGTARQSRGLDWRLRVDP